MVSSAFDITMARFKHLNWIYRIKSFLDGKKTITKKQAVSQYDCDFGKWLYSSGLNKYKQFPEMAELEKVHESLHTLIRNIVILNKKNNSPQAFIEYKKVEVISDQIIRLLDV